MKKVFLSFTALAIGASVSFAQTVESEIPQDQGSDIQMEKLSNSAESTGKKKIEIGELPAAVHEAFKESEFKDWEVSEVYEIKSSENEGFGSESDVALAEGEDATYEILVITKDMKDEIEDSQEAIEEVNENALEADRVDAEETNVGSGTITVEVPAVILQYDKEGNLIKQEDQYEAQETEILDQY